LPFHRQRCRALFHCRFKVFAVAGAEAPYGLRKRSAGPPPAQEGGHPQGLARPAPRRCAGRGTPRGEVHGPCARPRDLAAHGSRRRPPSRTAAKARRRPRCTSRRAAPAYETQRRALRRAAPRRGELPSFRASGRRTHGSGASRENGGAMRRNVIMHENIQSPERRPGRSPSGAGSVTWAITHHHRTRRTARSVRHGARPGLRCGRRYAVRAHDAMLLLSEATRAID
jgi:hypothetical protein